MTASNLVIEPFSVHVDDEAISDLRARLSQTRWPDQLDDQPWVYGTDIAELRALVQYWAKDFDWRVFEAKLNRFEQFTTTIDGENVHFIHARSARADATPLLLTHGWPGSIVEFLDLIDPLTSPDNDDQPAFHVVVPSLPGFGFSGATVTTGVSPKRIASMWAQLMEGLGYRQYLAQGGDWGSIITGWIGKLDPANCAGIHLNMTTVAPTEELLNDMTPEEQEVLGSLMHFQEHETGYQAIQSTKPQTIAYSLADSPSGLLSWILEKFRTWSDCNGDVFSVHDRDTLLANVAIYWFTNTAGSSARIYYEFARVDQRAFATDIGVPTGIADFPKEIYRAPKRWAEAAFNLVHWSQHAAGGHFAALEQPELLLGDIRTFASSIK